MRVEVYFRNSVMRTAEGEVLKAQQMFDSDSAGDVASRLELLNWAGHRMTLNLHDHCAGLQHYSPLLPLEHVSRVRIVAQFTNAGRVRQGRLELCVLGDSKIAKGVITRSFPPHSLTTDNVTTFWAQAINEVVIEGDPECAFALLERARADKLETNYTHHWD